MKYKEIAEYLSNLNPHVPSSLLTLIALVKIAEIGGLNNLEAQSNSIDSPDHTTPANMYVLTFLNSAGGKDKPLRDIDKNLADDIDTDFIQRAKLSRQKRETGLKQEAVEVFKDNPAEQKKYIVANRPRFLIREISDATLEGFIAMRQEYYKCGWGGTFVKISEFGDYITSDNSARSEFLSMLTEVFDNGDNNPKIIKGEREVIPVRNVPNSAVFHTSPAGLLEGKNREKLMTFLNRGGARRTFTCYPEKSSISDKNNIHENLKINRIRRDKAYKDALKLKEYVNLFYQSTRCEDNIVYNTHNTFVFTPEADERIDLYKEETLQKSERIKDDTNRSGLAAELSGRAWKALKLATIIAAFEHPKVKEVTETDVKEAIAICDTYASHLARFYKTQPTTDYERLYNYLISNLNKWITTMQIREQNFVYHSKFKRFFDESRSALEEQLEHEGYVLESKTTGRRGMKYRVVSITQAQTETKVTLSQAKTNSPTDTKYEPKYIPFEDLHRITGMNRSWSATTFKDNYRKDENADTTIDMVVFDIDEGLSLKDCIQMFTDRKIKALITTTRNHQKSKLLNKTIKLPTDRYRVILPLSKKEKLDKTAYPEKIKLIAQAFDLPIDISARNISRSWFGNPEQEYHYIEGGCIDLSVFHEEKKVYQDRYQHMNGQGVEGIKKWFVENWEKYAGRNNMLFRAGIFFHKEKHMSFPEIQEQIVDINQNLPNPLSPKEIEMTVFKSLRNKIQ